MDLSTAKFIMDYLYFKRENDAAFHYHRNTKCSMFRGVILCLCLNLTYANVVRFPREFDRYGAAFLFPFILLFFCVGLPIVLLEVALGQFLGQDSAHAWRASPILRGASIVGRIASWLGAITVSLHGVLGMVYTGEILVKSVPFSQCVTQDNYFNPLAIDGQECLQKTFLTPIWHNTLYYAMLSMSLIVIWTLAAVCTYSGTVLRRSIIVIGLLTLPVLVFQTGWETAKIFNQKKEISFTISVDDLSDIISFDSSIWFAALVQVLFSTNIGIGVLPVVTGKFIYKGDAVRTSLVYMSFNVLVLLLSTTFFMTQYNHSNATISIPELKPFSSVYDSAVDNLEIEQSALLAGITYSMIALITMTTIALQIYTASRLIRRHPNFTMILTGLIVAIVVLICPKYLVARIFDTRVVGSLIACALVFDVIAVAWIYGAKNIYTDLEFSIGRPISKLWAFMWCIVPIEIAALLTWWVTQSSDSELGSTYMPRWLPPAFGLGIIAFLACAEVYKQVDYNCCNMIRGAGVSSKDWGPADPIVRHAWKQWTDVCEDTGQKDFTLRRRGTRDYTHSIKRGQRMNGGNATTMTTQPYIGGAYSIKTSTLNRNSPKYTGSIFGDSAIEEDISVANYPHVQRVIVGGNDDSNNALVSSTIKNSDGRTDTHKMLIRLQPTTINHTQRINVRPGATSTPSNVDLHRQHSHHSATGSNSSAAVDVSSFGLFTERDRQRDRNIARIHTTNTSPRHSTKPLNTINTELNYGSLQRARATNILPPLARENEHICWRKYNGGKVEEFSTEL